MNYNEVYVKKLIKLYEKYIDAISFDNKRNNSEQLKRLLEILHSIFKFTLKSYLNDYDKILTRYTYDLNEELKKLEDLLYTIKQRDDFINKYIGMYEVKTGEKVSNEILDFSVSSDKEPIEYKIDLIKQYNDNNALIESLIKENSEYRIESTNLNKMIKEYKHDNAKFGQELNQSINKLLIDYGIYNIDKDDVEEYYPKYQELYFKAKEQRENGKYNLSDIYDMAVENYNNYNFKFQLLNILSALDLDYNGYEQYYNKVNTIENIIENINSHPIYDKINSVLDFEYERLAKQKDSIDQLELIENSLSNNEELIKELKNKNNQTEIRKITNQFITNSVLLNEVKNEKVVSEPIKTEKIVYDKNNIVNVEPSPDWLINEINKNEYKFINWFKKVSNLIFSEN